MYICENIGKNEKGHLTFAGHDTTELAGEYATPLYLMDEERIRTNCRTYLEAFKKHMPEGSMPLYAGKANCFKQIYRILSEEKMGIDVVSPGEIYTAASAGFDMSKAFFHGNNKTDEDIRFAIEMGVGFFVADNKEEILAIEAAAENAGICQNILLRVTPGIDPHTFAAVSTGKVDSKFGAAVQTGSAMELTRMILKMEHISLKGFHCHVGSQVFGEDVFERAADVMVSFAADVYKETGFPAEIINLGGGFGVRYTDDDPYLDVAGKVKLVADAFRGACERCGIKAPAVLMEPGRSIVADAGMTLYTAGSVKNIPGFKTYVSIDGGMADNPRFALYGSRYTCLNASKQDEPCEMECSLVGRCCESGDIIAEGIKLPSATGRGDVIAVCTTGAYNYSMASNYNRLARPAVVMLRKEDAYVAVRRETFADLTALDI